MPVAEGGRCFSALRASRRLRLRWNFWSASTLPGALLAPAGLTVGVLGSCLEQRLALLQPRFDLDLIQDRERRVGADRLLHPRCLV
jgi:hypothetical protein